MVITAYIGNNFPELFFPDLPDNGLEIRSGGLDIG